MAKPARRWGWHQLDPRVAQQLVADAHLPRGALVLDIGAGTGAITAPLLAAGCRVVAFELHPRRATALERRFSTHVTVVRADAADLRLPRRPFHVVANPPHAISAAIVRRLLHPGSRLVSARLVLPDWAVRRWTSPTAPGMGRWSPSFVVHPGPLVPAGAFRPHAPRPARVLVIERR